MRCRVRASLTRILSVAALAATMAAPLQAQPMTVYDNSDVDLFITYPYLGANATRIGDVVTLGGTNRILQDLAVQFYNFGEVPGTFDALLELYSYDSAVGSLIGSATTTGVAIGADDIVTVTFSGLNLLVPDQFAFAVGIFNVTGDIDVGLNVFGPPGIGSSDDTMFLADVGNGLEGVTVPSGEGNLYMVATAVPASSPPLAMLVMMALVGFTRTARRRSDA